MPRMCRARSCLMWSIRWVQSPSLVRISRIMRNTQSKNSITGERAIFHQRPNALTARKPVGPRNVSLVSWHYNGSSMLVFINLLILKPGYRCEWCGMTTHAGCRMYLPTECNFGILQPIYLPPHSVSIPRTEVPIEAIIGVQVKSKTTLVRDYSCRKYIVLSWKDILEPQIFVIPSKPTS